MKKSLLFLEDETLLGNLPDPLAKRLIGLAEPISQKFPECLDSFLKVIRLTNDLASDQATIDKSSILYQIVWITGITLNNGPWDTESLLQEVVAELEKNYGFKKKD